MRGQMGLGGAVMVTQAAVGQLRAERGDGRGNVQLLAGHHDLPECRWNTLRPGERFGKLQFRAEFYNSFNHVNFGGPTASLNNRNFGRILSAGSPRILQFALRYTF